MPARQLTRLAGLLLLALGCGSKVARQPDLGVSLPDLAAPQDLAASADLAASVPHDLGPDLAPLCGYADDAFTHVGDATGFCDGTPLAGTCVQTFFAKLAVCFAPAGCCIGNSSSATGTVAWASGATLQWNYDRTGTWTQDGRVCMSAPHGDTTQPITYTAGDGSTLTIAPNGDVTCPDGSVIFIANNFSSCPALNNLFGQAYECNSRDPSCCVPFRAPGL